VSRADRESATAWGITLKEPDAAQSQNWADFIDSLHVFRAPTPRLERAARMDHGGERSSGAAVQSRTRPTDGFDARD
jgi:hypothetical protein